MTHSLRELVKRSAPLWWAHISVGTFVAGGGATVLTGGAVTPISVPAMGAGVLGVAGATVNSIKLIATPVNAKSADGESRPTTLEPGPHAGESIPARGPERDFNAAEVKAGNSIGAKTGCHTCGTTDPGTKSQNFVLDHQPASALNPNNGPQRLYPQCLTCSRRQGGEVRQAVRGMRLLAEE